MSYSAWSALRAGSGSQARGGAGGAYRRPCPVLPSARCGGRSVNLNAAASASPGRRLLPVLVCSRRSTCRGPSSSSSSSSPAFAFQGFLTLFGTEDGARRGTLDAMSRRKLGSRPQHLSAIQGKASGAAMCGGHL